MAALSATLLPAERPRYLMGVGTPEDLLAAVRWATTCSIACCRRATRATAARSPATAASQSSRPLHARDPRPLDEGCGCRTCTRLSRAYLRHLYMSGEILAARALTEHNLYFYARLMRWDAGCYRISHLPGVRGQRRWGGLTAARARARISEMRRRIRVKE